ncbi:MAG TPA: hypothetical protein VH593_10465 [Ktedonobacteraceae bacterium]|jgi:hypothetical protein
MIKYVIVCSGPIYEMPENWIRQALIKSYDPDYRKGEGRCKFTHDIREALLFDSLQAAVAYTERVPVNNPLTEAGTVNRPIRAFKVAYRAFDLEQEKKRLHDKQQR